jgi:hypothetical protein
VQHREGIARGSEEFTTATSNRETFPIIQTAIPEARHIYGSSDGIDFFAERIERFMDGRSPRFGHKNLWLTG